MNLSLQAVSPKPVHVREPVLAGGILAGGIKLVALGTHDMVADTFTKRLPAPALVRHREVLNFSWAAKNSCLIAHAICALATCYGMDYGGSPSHYHAYFAWNRGSVGRN